MLEAIRDILIWMFRPIWERHKGNLRIALFCFILSSIIWLFNSLNNHITTHISVPLKIVYNNHIFLPSKELPKNIHVELGGNGWHLVKNSNFLLPKIIYLNIKHPSLNSKIDTSSIRNYLESHFNNLKIKRILIDQLEIPFDRKSHKYLFLNVDINSISLANGFERDSIISIDPNRILVSGSSTELTEISDSLHIKIPFQGLDKDFNEKIRLSYFLNNSNLKLSHETVLVKFKIKRKSYAESK
jgi:hypothetical protein